MNREYEHERITNRIGKKNQVRKKGGKGAGYYRASANTARAAPASPAAPEIATRPAPLVDEVVVGFAVDVPVDEAFDDVVVVIFADVVAAVVLAGVDAGVVADPPPRGAVERPSISDWTEAAKVPDMLFKVNLAENARAGNCGLVASGRARDSTRMK
jgi:hypothetical protein